MYTEDNLRFRYETRSLQFARAREANTANIPPPRAFQRKSIQTRCVYVRADAILSVECRASSIIIVVRSETTPFGFRREPRRRVYRDFDLRTCMYTVCPTEMRQTRRRLIQCLVFK